MFSNILGKSYAMSLLLFLILLSPCVYVLYRRNAPRGGDLRRVPGPLVASFSPLWMVYHAWIGDVHQRIVELHREYGLVVRVGPNEVSITDMEAMKTIYGRLTLMYVYDVSNDTFQDQAANLRRAISTACSKVVGSLTSLVRGMGTPIGRNVV